MNDRTSSTDFDMDGCYDSTEDLDDDNDSVNDVNATGATLDLCPTTPLGALDVDEFGCADHRTRTDGDSINDLIDECEGTPSGLQVNAVGCQILTMMACLQTSIFVRIVHSVGPSMRMGVQSTRNLYNGPQAQVFQGRWILFLHSPFPHLMERSHSRTNGLETIYLFMFKYTDGSGNSNSGTWSTNPGTFIRNLPRTHICSMVHLILHTTTMFSQERVMLSSIESERRRTMGWPYSLH